MECAETDFAIWDIRSLGVDFQLFASSCHRLHALRLLRTDLFQRAHTCEVVDTIVNKNNRPTFQSSSAPGDESFRLLHNAIDRVVRHDLDASRNNDSGDLDSPPCSFAFQCGVQFPLLPICKRG